MSIKRALFALGAMLLGFGSFVAFPQEANAAITCTAIKTTITTWPNGDWTQKCVNSSFPTVPTTTSANDMNAAVASSIHGAAISELKRAANRNFTNLNGVRYYLFRNSADYASWAGAGAVSHDPAEFGVTKFDSRNIPVYSAIFETNDLGETNVRRATGTQIGVALNTLQGYVKNGGIVPVILFRVSDTVAAPANAWQNIYKQNLDADWAAINTKQPCKVGSTLGLFSRFADKRLPVTSSTYICNDDPTTPSVFGDGVGLSPDYATIPGCPGAACNQAILNKAWPDLYPSIHTMYSQAYSFTYIGDDNATTGRTRDFYMVANFKCSKWFATTIGDTGRLPIATDNPPAGAGCIVPPVPNKCVKEWNGKGRWPDGNVFNCISPTNAIASQALTAFEKLGGTTYTNAKNKLDLARSDVYFFADDASYTSTFLASGEDYGTIAGQCGTTGPVGITSVRRWRSIINQSCTLATTPGKQTYVATHELGHIIDLTHTNPGSGAADQPSGQAQFDIAMQVDIYKLNYTSWTNPTTFVYRLPCGTGAPLAGEVDANGVAFCNGSALSSTYSAYVGNSITTILKVARPHELTYASSSFVGHPTDPAQQVAVLPGWYEWYAQGWAVRGTIPMSAAPNVPVYDNLMQKGWFECTLGPKASSTPPPKGWMQLTLEDPFANVQVSSLGPNCQFSALPAGWVFLH